MNKLLSLTDTELVLAYQSKQDNLFYAEIYKRFNEKIYRYCTRLLNDSEMASDATQDVFVKIKDRLLKLKSPATFSSWLYRVAHNHCMDVLKSKKHNYTILDYKIHEIESYNYDYEKHSHQENHLSKLNQFMNGIPSKDKELLEAKYIERRSIIDLMETYNLSESAVKMRLSRARQKVKKLFEGNQISMA